MTFMTLSVDDGGLRGRLARLETLEAENEALRTRVAVLTGATPSAAFMLRQLGFTPTTGLIACCFYRTPEWRRAHLVGAIWGDDPHGGPEHAEGILRQHIFHTRRTLRRYAIEMDSVFGAGVYRMDSENHARLRSLLRGIGTDVSPAVAEVRSRS